MAAIAARLGSDVTVCLANRPSLMTGRGEVVEPVGNFPACGVLLANPGIPLPAASVYAELRADDLRAPLLLGGDGPPDFHGDFAQLLVYALPRLNDLEAPAARLVPEIREVLAALLALDGPRLARLSGSGPTCFALFATEAEAGSAGVRLARGVSPLVGRGERARQLERPVDAELDRFQQGSLYVAIGEDSQRVAGDGAVVPRPLQRVVQGIVPLHQRKGLGEIVRRRSRPLAACAARKRARPHCRGGSRAPPAA